MKDIEPPVPPAAPAAKDPQPTVDRIDELARRILSGDILLPKFQRDFVWERSQILSCWDSVARGYPIGSILLWLSRQELRSENKIADLDIQLPKPEYPVNYLLDGQQRLSTICGAIYWHGTDPDSIWNIAYDTRTREFLHLDSLDDPPLHQIRVNKLSDPAEFFKHVYSLDSLGSLDKVELKKSAEQLFNRFKDYKIATVTLGDMSIDDVAPIFERVNSEGTRLTIVDLMRAATWSPDFDLVDSINEILSDLKQKDFYSIDRKVLLRNVSSSAGGGYSTASIDNLRKFAAAELKDAIAITREAYKHAVDFLVTELRIPDARVLPYVNQMTVLADIFRVVGHPTAPQLAAIARWFWKTSLAGYFGGWNTGSMARDHAAVKAFGARTTSEIEFLYTAPSHAIWRTRQFRSNNSLAKTFAIILCSQGPLDLLNGQKIDVATALAWENQKEFHHFFPRKYLETRGETERINALANIVLLTSASNKTISASQPSKYLLEVSAHAGPHLDLWLSSNLINKAAYDAALRDDYDGFLEARSKCIHDAVLAMTK